MIDVKVIASGSSGNCTCLTANFGEKILCDVGVPLKKIFSDLDFMNPDYAIVTHEHGDHAHGTWHAGLYDRRHKKSLEVGQAS